LALLLGALSLTLAKRWQLDASDEVFAGFGYKGHVLRDEISIRSIPSKLTMLCRREVGGD
jgi:hypothetical protein